MSGLDNNQKICTIQIERQNLPFILRIVRKIFFLFNLSKRIPLLYFKKSFLKKVALIGDDDKIFLKGITDVNELYIMSSLLPKKIEKHFWFWNPLDKEYKDTSKDEIKKHIKRLNSFGFIIETFDKADADFYNISFRNQFYRYPQKKNANFEEIYDFYFLGNLKDRENEILEIKNKLCNLDFKVNFNLIRRKEEELSYHDNIDNILKSKCIVDINQKGQSGMTVRPLEAIFFNKKLITDNKNILNEDFYNSNNIFVLGVDNIGLLSHFMKKDAIKLSSSILDKYDINHWMEHYI